MEKIEITATDNHFTVSFPPLAFAFNPVALQIEAENDCELKIVCAQPAITLVRRTFNRLAVFDLSGLALSLFQLRPVCQPAQNDTQLLQQLQFTLYADNEAIVAEPLTVPVLWGAMQPGEVYTQNRRLTCFRGYPFTLPFYSAQAQNTLVCRIDGLDMGDWQTLAAGKYNLNIDALLSMASSRVEVQSGAPYDSPFDYTFDQSFRRLSASSVNLEVDIVGSDAQGCYLRWLNAWGEWNYYLWQPKASMLQTRTADYGYNATRAQNFLSSPLCDAAGMYSAGKEAQKSLQLVVPLADEQTWAHLSGMFTSPVVDLFTGYDSESGAARWLRVEIGEGNFVRSSKRHLQDVECQMFMPQLFVQKM
jgi:hypothetical protein